MSFEHQSRARDPRGADVGTTDGGAAGDLRLRLALARRIQQRKAGQPDAGAIPPEMLQFRQAILANTRGSEATPVPSGRAREFGEAPAQNGVDHGIPASPDAENAGQVENAWQGGFDGRYSMGTAYPVHNAQGMGIMAPQGGFAAMEDAQEGEGLATFGAFGCGTVAVHAEKREGEAIDEAGPMIALGHPEAEASQVEETIQMCLSLARRGCTKFQIHVSIAEGSGIHQLGQLPAGPDGAPPPELGTDPATLERAATVLATRVRERLQAELGVKADGSGGEIEIDADVALGGAGRAMYATAQGSMVQEDDGAQRFRPWAGQEPKR